MPKLSSAKRWNFPEEIKSLFENLGIDYHKESECLSNFDVSESSNFDEYVNKLHGYGGWFHFAGNILSGRECLDKNSNTYEVTQIAENFSIGFRKSKDLNFFESNIPLVQVEFEAKIPWIIGEMIED